MNELKNYIDNFIFLEDKEWLTFSKLFSGAELRKGDFFALEGRTEDGFIVLDEVEGKTVVVWVSGPPDEFDEFLPKARKAFDTVEWEGK